MNGRYLLDTNIVIALFGEDEVVKNRLGQTSETFVSSVVLGELYYGARKSTKVAENIQQIDHFASTTPVLLCDQETARQYGQIKNELRTKGRPIPENDIWIAALALQHGLTLAARDRHFEEIETLTLETW